MVSVKKKKNPNGGKKEIIFMIYRNIYMIIIPLSPKKKYPKGGENINIRTINAICLTDSILFAAFPYVGIKTNINVPNDNVTFFLSLHFHAIKDSQK